MSSNKKNPKYWIPLQTHPDTGKDQDVDLDDELVQPPISNKKSKIPSVCVLQKTCENVHGFLAELKLDKYCLKKMSIGIKLICEDLETYDKVCAELKRKNWQFYTHDLPTERSFKVMLYGLHELCTSELKQELNNIGLKCQNVKLIKKNYDQFIDIFYLVYLEIGSIRLSDIKKKCRSIFKTQVRWDFARRPRNKITQCYNCQMYGHGEKHCHIKTHCANCSENHDTKDCKSNTIKCANCMETHKSTDPVCISRKSFFEIREKLSARNKSSTFTKRIHNEPSQSQFISNANDFPALKPINRNISSSAAATNKTDLASNDNSNFWANNINKTGFLGSNNNNNTNSTSVLFSLDEINSLTAEMITLLSQCHTKADQFNCIAQLAIKYLYAGK